MDFRLDPWMTSHQIAEKSDSSCRRIMSFEDECIHFFLDIIQRQLFSVHLCDETIQKDQTFRTFPFTNTLVSIRYFHPVVRSNTFLDDLEKEAKTKVLACKVGARYDEIHFVNIHAGSLELLSDHGQSTTDRRWMLAIAKGIVFVSWRFHPSFHMLDEQLFYAQKIGCTHRTVACTKAFLPWLDCAWTPVPVAASTQESHPVESFEHCRMTMRVNL